MSRQDLEFLKRVYALGMQGASQDEIAASESTSRTTLRYRLACLGFTFKPLNDLVSTREGESFAELVALGELAADESAPEPAGVSG